MTHISPPKYALNVLHRLESAGFQAFLVGGCVRDMLMNCRPQDWDICTNALPEQVTALFPRTHPTGIKHGTVTVVSLGKPLEVTTYRNDGEYADHRRPDKVRFVSSLDSDLERRDFTMNAIAMSASGELFDPFGGKSDIAARLIRCVGEPDKRFDEDALRMLRALRFSAVLGFEIDGGTLAAIERSSALVSVIAAERVRAELEKTLCSERPQTVARMISLGLLEGFVKPARAEIDLSPLAVLPKTPALRWAGLCAILERNALISESESFLRALRLDNETLRCVSAGCTAVKSGIPLSPADYKRLCARLGDAGARCTAAAAEALGHRGRLSALRRVIRSGECRALSQLAVTGGDLEALGYHGKAIGGELQRLLEYVIESPEQNMRERLLSLAENDKNSPLHS